MLRQFGSYMILMGMQLESASGILIEVANMYRLDIELTCSLLAELQTNLKSSKNTTNSQIKKSLGKRERERATWGKFLVFGLVIEFLDLN